MKPKKERVVAPQSSVVEIFCTLNFEKKGSSGILKGYETNFRSAKMNPHEIFCPNLACPAKGQVGKGNIGIHSRKKQRYLCRACGKTFTTTTGTIFYRLQTDPEQVACVLTLLAHGCPLPAIGAAFGYDERTVKNWWQKAGRHCRDVHQHLVARRQFDLGQIQADEIKAKIQGGFIWLAMVLMVSTRLWLGGEISPRRDRALLEKLVARIRAMALYRPLPVAVDGLPGYVNAFRRAFRTKLPRRGQRGRSRLRPWSVLNLVQGVKHRYGRVLTVERRVVWGRLETVTTLIHKTQGGKGKINTAFIERLNATFRQR